MFQSRQISFTKRHDARFKTHRAQLAAQPGVAAPGWRVQAGPCRAELGRARLGQARPAGPGRPGQAGEAGQAEGGAPRGAVRAPICRFSTPLGGVRGGCSSYGVSVEVCLI